MSPQTGRVETVEGQATSWFARLRSGTMSEAETQGLQDWLDADMGHRVAFDAVEAVWAGFAETRDVPAILALRATARRRPLPALTWRMAAACAAAGVLGVGAWAGSALNVFRSHELPDQTFRTDVGQRSTVTLPDGSVVTLNTGTVLRTKSDAGRRVIYLDHGQAFFKVAKDRAHPFVVHAAGRTVTALGTAFDVRAEPGHFEVTLVEGKVRVETPLPARKRVGVQPAPAVQTTEMLAGNQLTATDDNRWTVERADTELETAWLSGWLKFENEPLGDVVAELSRYSDAKILLADSELASIPVSGRFKANDLNAFLEAVQVYGIQPSGPLKDGVIRLALVQEQKS